MTSAPKLVTSLTFKPARAHWLELSWYSTRTFLSKSPAEHLEATMRLDPTNTMAQRILNELRPMLGKEAIFQP